MVKPFRLWHLLAVIKGKSKGIAKGSESTLDRVGFSTFEGEFMRLSWGGSFGFAAT